MMLIDEWRRELRRLWSIRVALFGAALSGIWGCWPAFQDYVPPGWFAVAGVVLSMAIVALRLIKQPDPDE